MTVIVGLKHQGDVWIAADSRVSEDSLKVDTVCPGESKLIRLKHAVIGASGDLVFRNYLELFVTKGNTRNQEFNSKLDVIEFFLGFKRYLKRYAGLGEAEPSQVLHLPETSWLIATRTRLWDMDESGGVIEQDKFVAVGSGQKLALGVLEYFHQFPVRLSPEEILKRVHKVVVAHDPSCGGEQQRINVTRDHEPDP